jgi:hypothetical protein
MYAGVGVHDHNLAALVHHDVLRLEVAMDHPAIVRRREPGAEPPRRFDRFIRGQPADAREQRREVLAVHVFHRDERHALDLANVVHAADVRVRDQARHPHLAVETLEQALVVRRFLGQELQSDRLTQRQVHRPVDLTHPAAAQQRENAISSAEQSAGNKAAFIFRDAGDA